MKQDIFLTSEFIVNSLEHVCFPGVSTSETIGKYVGTTIIIVGKEQMANITHQPTFI